jgi:hypothetical protein
MSYNDMSNEGDIPHLRKRDPIWQTRDYVCDILPGNNFPAWHRQAGHGGAFPSTTKDSMRARANRVIGHACPW